MLIVYLGLYTFFLALIWGLFIVAKIHAFKFKNFSSNIIKVTNFLLFFLITLSILGYVIIFTLPVSTNTTSTNNWFDTRDITY